MTLMKSYKNVVITGAASGIGAALVARFAAEDASIVASDRNEVALRNVANRYNCNHITADVGVPSDVSSLAEKSWKLLGGVDLLCLNAGVAGPHKPAWEKSVAEWEWVLRPNLWGLIHGIQSFVPRMIEQITPSAILITASAAGFISSPFGADYLASKHAAVSIAESIAQEFQSLKIPIDVRVLCPGFVRTNILRSMRSQFDAQFNADSEAQLADYESLLEASPSPEEVVDIALRQWNEGAFYLMTHPELDAYVERRHAAISSRRLPELS
ncbi:MAG: SDR family NAD(P)-dependent oxidoreductase [Acidobacteria bacterium]|nr:SDR family NAD(P)-dependent oxidoreductase [Acidobacteriota bacterium]